MLKKCTKNFETLVTLPLFLIKRLKTIDFMACYVGKTLYVYVTQNGTYKNNYIY
jgi:hypothetical protein